MVYWLGGLTCTDENFIIKVGIEEIENDSLVEHRVACKDRLQNMASQLLHRIRRLVRHCNADLFVTVHLRRSWTFWGV